VAGGVEIERKWLVAAVPDAARAVAEAEIEQGYLVIDGDGSEIRLRRRDTEYFLTAKTGRGLRRTELETELEEEQFAALWPGTEGRRLQKTRRKLNAEGGLTIELDVYLGSLTGLVVAEVEFPDEASARRFREPDWFGPEVTDDDAYRNRRLAVEGRPGHPLNGG
jgi:CYTH domain-containing protein